ncbi:MAG: peptide deformylase [bacterium]
MATKKIPPSPIEIVQEDNPVLRKKAQAVPLDEITSPRIQKIIADMIKALDSQDDGVGIAAPQIGYSLAIFAISGKALERINQAKDGDEAPKKTYKNLVFINPRIIKLSKEKKWMDEGCLSVRWLYGKVERAIRATVSAYDENGKSFERGGGGVLAHIYQHEVDHLNGTLFIDKAVDLEEMEPEENENAK